MNTSSNVFPNQCIKQFFNNTNTHIDKKLPYNSCYLLYTTKIELSFFTSKYHVYIFKGSIFMNKQLYVTLFLLTANLQFASQQQAAPQIASQSMQQNTNAYQPDDGRSPRQDDEETCRKAFILALEQQRLAREKIANSAKK